MATFSAKCAVRTRIVAFVINVEVWLKLRTSLFLNMTFVKAYYACLYGDNRNISDFSHSLQDVKKINKNVFIAIYN